MLQFEMLVLERKLGQGLVIGDNIEVVVTRFGNDTESGEIVPVLWISIIEGNISKIAKLKQKVVYGYNSGISFEYLSRRQQFAKIGITAPKEVTIYRKELLDRVKTPY